MNALKLIALAFIVFVLGQLNQWAILDKVFFALVGLLVIAWFWGRVSLTGVALTRESKADRAQVGQPLQERVRIQNRSRLTKLWVELIDHSDLPGHRVSKVLHLGPNDSRRWRVETICSRRGRFRIGPMSIRSGDPFGLFPNVRFVPETHELLVYPATVDLSAFALPVGSLPGGSAIQRRTPFVTPNASGVRDYMPGDAFNRISWTATARTGKMMVKEFELDPTADIWIVVDLQAGVHAGATTLGAMPSLAGDEVPLAFWLDSTEEYAVTVAASLARHFLAQNRAVGLIASARQHIAIPTDRGGRQMIKILEQLAVVRADGSVPFAELLLAEGAQFTRNSTVILVTPSTNEDWVQSAIGIVSRHVQCVAVVIEPTTFGAAESSLFVVSTLAAVGVPTYLVKYGDDITRALATYSIAPGGRVPRV
ncbi:MAG TPA: DUF58 domain-containing protein [Thermomicrobiales bacterium]|nr:DUF58 domain-containing protein [Chloroflexota bacterium]HQX62668.1 DUF58 domain-containing protein [Thermomicrobiales bacterium]HBY45633.1 DUF58 domain-containing protein [Chloroflexota bacterium]HCG28541.1 DUF58 domain-containing protein [Chloroflexota bacterium]HQZ90091.1 DUF58 domain-containing protein [Thermomicrobiales bacterium]